eukprot:SAG31_NODE_1223_length_9288_cov_8.411253_6_plen_171_part_00
MPGRAAALLAVGWLLGLARASREQCSAATDYPAAPPSLVEQLRHARAVLAEARGPVGGGGARATTEELRGLDQRVQRLQLLQDEASAYRTRHAKAVPSPAAAAAAAAEVTNAGDAAKAVVSDFLPAYHNASTAARGWLNSLELDSSQLIEVGIPGKKKLAELVRGLAVAY